VPGLEVQVTQAALKLSRPTFSSAMARGSTLLRNTKVKLHAMSEASYRTVGLAWRKGSRRSEEFRLLGRFFESCHTPTAAA